ncbi:ParA family protein [Sporanaerobacter acetigenes]|uniref:Chromosome partitioning ATPase, Mrp family, contains Fe-S cluster n=1 Tax=Sporanaerobacter acetigenes DSM 13106 TaxID=1123281 RepID=A0A1M5XAD0_9FIRM|nr:ParA family protein [Sporanaerobacter acetigenes]SHH96827.1 Chromosome partitioning ATPase, Mrp family, contains Fe-S cluster [Sporanaerobacter acetigenes DSM 13106]
MSKENRIRIIIGHYGSGKTEFSINYAVKLAKEGKKVALVDLDVVNLYFRSREKEEILNELGIKVISSSIKASAVDIPAISAEAYGPLEDSTFDTILDVGGDPAGARVLGRYHELLKDGEYEMYYVLNANRPETSTVEKAVGYLNGIEGIARAKVTGIINNTHMLKSTTVEDVMKGQKLASELSQKLDIPIKYIVALEDVAKKLPEDLEGEIFPIKLYMREDWML